MRHFRLGAAVVAGMLISAASAHAQALLYSFESGDSPNALDGFSDLAGDSLSNSTTLGVTQGAQSLFVNNTSSSFAGYATSSVPAIFNTDTVTGVTLNVTWPSGEVYGGGYYLLGVTLYDNSATSPYDGTSLQVPGSDEQSIYQAVGTGLPQTITIPINGNDPISGNPTTYGALIDNGWVTTGFEIFEDHNAPLQYAVDNIQADGVSVPEPASIGIGAVGSLILMARRRRAAR